MIFSSDSGLYWCSGGPEWLRYIIARAQGCALGLQNCGSTSWSSRPRYNCRYSLGSWLYSNFCFLGADYSPAREGGAFSASDWAAGQSSGQSENSPSEGGRGGVQTCCVYPSKMQVVVLYYIPLTSKYFPLTDIFSVQLGSILYSKQNNIFVPLNIIFWLILQVG
jgi:hypothetical protein